MTEVFYSFVQLPEAPLLIDAVYEGGSSGNISDDPISKLFPGVGNQGGFRAAQQQNDSGEIAYVVIYTSNQELEWPDYLDVETGVFRYYGDNRQPGSSLHETRRGGNVLLKETFEKLHTGKQNEIPPFFIFEKTGKGRDVRFLGLAAPGNQHIAPDRDLVSFWRTMHGQRFQNYEAYFTVLDLKLETITREWLTALRSGNASADNYAPSCWIKFKENGRKGIQALQSPRIIKVPTKTEQLPQDDIGKAMLDAIRAHYASNPYGFEKCACVIAGLIDGNFSSFELTRPWRDGGRDAIGKYRIGLPYHALTVDFALEAKCYSASGSVRVKEMSRLISRIKYRQFGVMVTTGYVHDQAYKEVIEDGHPILIITAADIARVLIENAVTPETIDDWLKSIDAD